MSQSVPRLASVIEAVQCAVEVQGDLAEWNGPLPEDRRMRFRIGVNLGDIIEEADGTVYGDGVNVAARLEGLAEPGGVMISESAHMQVRNRIDVGFEDAGARPINMSGSDDTVTSSSSSRVGSSERKDAWTTR